jgi:hypothetical protein
MDSYECHKNKVGNCVDLMLGIAFRKYICRWRSVRCHEDSILVRYGFQYFAENETAADVLSAIVTGMTEDA